MCFEVYYADGTPITDWKKICKEEWADYLDPEKIECFMIDADGFLWLMDKNAAVAMCPPGKNRFKIVYYIGNDLDKYEKLY